MTKDKICALKVNNLFKKYGDHCVLKDISLSIACGEFLTIFGVSGSGKSTFLKVLAGIESLSNGQVYINNKNVTSLPPEKRNLGFVFQRPLLFPHMTVSENIAFGLKVKKKKKKEIELKVKNILKSLEMTGFENYYPNEISGGQQQRIAIGRALAIDPPILLLDEPFNGLDQKLRMEMGQFLKKIQKEYHISIAFVTHDVDEALRLSDKIAVLHEGKILQWEESLKVYYQPMNQQVGDLMGPGNWVKGYVKDQVFHSPFGQHSAANYEPGPYHLFLRPHQIKEDNTFKGMPCQVVDMNPNGRTNQILCKYENNHLVYESPIRTISIKNSSEIYLIPNMASLQLIKCNPE
jgi:ABC-type Fe3+/spermidine/putrescine transport system ATPase subunit